jgi:integrase/recombinase XerD
VQYMSAERRFSPATVKKYEDNVRRFIREIGDVRIQDIHLGHFISLKAYMGRKGAGEARIGSIIFAMKSLLVYAHEVLGVPILNLEKVRAPRRPRRDVVYLSPSEINQFLGAIMLDTSWDPHPHVTGYCLRALVEVLLASAMRIGEALALDRASVNFQKREGAIVGKGNKQRTVFFTERALEWLERYLALRKDRNPALFVTISGHRLKVGTAEAMFRRVSDKAQFERRVTPHTLRHTAATRLLHNGCPIGFIKEVLGHERLETTCRFYLGILDKADTKNAFNSYTSYQDLNKETAPHVG